MDVRIIPLARDDPWPPGIPENDFWLFDDAQYFAMRYDAQGGWLGIEHVPDAASVACAVRDVALHLAQSWASYIGERPELAAVLPVVQWN